MNMTETGSDDKESDFEEHPGLANRACVAQSGRTIRAFRHIRGNNSYQIHFTGKDRYAQKRGR